MTTYFRVLPFLLLVTAPAIAQSARTPEYKLGTVIDRRSTGSFANLSLNIELPAIKRAEVTAARVILKSASGADGESLLKEDEAAPEFSTMQSGYGMAVRPVTVDLYLKTPPREMTSIAEISGDIELSMPSRDPNSVATIAKFKGSAGKPLNHKALKANGIDAMILTRAQIDKERKLLIDKKRAELKADGYEGESFDMMLSSFSEYLYNPEPKDIVLKLRDPKKVIRDIAFVNGAGERQMAGGGERESFYVISTWGEEAGNDWGLRFEMNTTKSVRKIPFVLKDVPLP